MKKQTHARSSAGYTLIELLVAATVLALMLGAIALVGSANDRAYQTGITAAHLEAQTEVALDRIVRELRIAVIADFNPSPMPGTPDDSLEYSQAVDFVAGEVVLTRRRLEFDYEVGELDDGIDNNGNGLVDEGRVILTEDPGGPDERQLVLTRWVSELLQGEIQNGLDDNGNGLVDEPGFCIERADVGSRTLIVRLSLQRMDVQGRLMRRTAQTSTRIRN